ncbi:hypothetical protein E27107_200057 [Elizabethkingia anophelis]|nr:hypothetical protein E18064_360058 [Elizabethkingia anophelis]CDN77404.1 hypothetical protein E27107_200057 [Elizabethkingia anophelis]
MFFSFTNFLNKDSKLKFNYLNIIQKSITEDTHYNTLRLPSNLIF